MQVTVTYLGTPYQLETSARGHSIKTDAVDSAKNGTDDELNPHEHFLGSLGECAAMTMLMYAKRKGWTVDKLTVVVTEDKIDDPEDKSATPAKIPRIRVVATPEGSTLTDEQIAKLKEVGEKCPVKKLVMERKVIELEVKPSTAASK